MSYPSINLPSEDTMVAIKESVAQIAASQALLAASAAVDYQDIQNIIRRGLGPSALPVGTQVKLTHAVYGELISDVIGHNIDLDPLGRTPYSTTFLLHALLEATQFCPTQAFYHSAAGLAAGTYNFATPEYDKWLEGTYQFTLTTALPSGGQLVIGGQYPYQGALTLAKITSYASSTTTTALESNIAITVGSGGTSLGTMGTELNHVHRAAYGSNNLENAPIRQWLNSAAAANAWYTPKTNYDRPPAMLSRAGFFGGLSADLKSVIGETDHKTAINTVTDGGGISTLRDKIFLLSQEEIFGVGENGQDEGTQYPYYVDLTDEQRKKYYANGSVGYWWLRSPDSGYARNVRFVRTSGTLDSGVAMNVYGVAAAWTIY